MSVIKTKAWFIDRKFLYLTYELTDIQKETTLINIRLLIIRIDINLDENNSCKI